MLRLAVAELVDKLRVDRVLAAPKAEDVPGDLRRTADEELEAPDVRVLVVARRGREEDGAPPLREAPESKDLVFVLTQLTKRRATNAGRTMIET